MIIRQLELSQTQAILDKDLAPAVATNNPLAHVLRYQQVGSWQAIDSQIDAELTTELAERSQRAFVSGCQFEVRDDDLISDTGLSLRQLLDRGVEAAQADIAGVGSDYGYHRELARLGELDDLLEWYKQGAPGILMVNSLCPEPDELSPELARRFNFRAERQMSSNVFYQLNQGKVQAHYFSLDGHSLAKHNQLLNQLELPARHDSSLGILASTTQLDSPQSLRQALQVVFGEQDVVEIDPVALANIQASYKSISQEIAKSLKMGRVSSGLGRLALDHCLDLASYQEYDSQLAQRDLDKLRSQVLPHYAFGTQQLSITEAAHEAVRDNLSYQGACPTASSSSARPGAGLGWAHNFLLSRQIRLKEGQELLNRRAGHGQCQACHDRKPLYGCGAFCYSCNSRWCRTYMASGRQLNPKQIRQLAFFSFLA